MAKKFKRFDKGDNLLLLVLSVSLLVIAVLSFFITFVKVNEYKQKISGYDVQTGKVNITLTSVVSISLTNATIWWGDGFVYSNGSVNYNYNNATLFTNGTTSIGNVTGGNWSGSGVFGIVIINSGTINCTLNISSGLNATDFLGYSSVQPVPLYQYNVTNNPGSPLACTTNYTYTWHNNVWSDINASAGGASPKKVCSSFNSATGENQLDLDIKLVVPAASSKIASGGSLTDTITITGY